MAESIMRLYAGPDDQQAIVALIQARPAKRARDYPGVIDIQELLALAAVQAHTALWYGPGGQLDAYAILEDENLLFEISPQADQEAMGAHIIRWAEQQRAHETAPASESPAIHTSCSESFTTRLALLERHGFTRLDDYSVHMKRSLRDPIPAPRLPDGFTIRPVAGEAEVEAHVALHRAAFGTNYMTVEYRLAMMRVPTYDPALDLVAAAPDGTLAAYCMGFISPEENELTGSQDGYTDPVATSPAYQRRGLAGALMLAVMQQLKARGMDTARLGTSSDNVAMQRAAQSVGFVVDDRSLWLEKTVDAP
ncbi:MAG: GNAT family N-acetyltransferase [Anaerolineae bacterium]|nr:GNAT family N-acetyltransferase [Anaerolineae bacterium]